MSELDDEEMPDITEDDTPIYRSVVEAMEALFAQGREQNERRED